MNIPHAVYISFLNSGKVIGPGAISLFLGLIFQYSFARSNFKSGIRHILDNDALDETQKQLNITSFCRTSGVEKPDFVTMYNKSSILPLVVVCMINIFNTDVIYGSAAILIINFIYSIYYFTFTNRELSTKRTAYFNSAAWVLTFVILTASCFVKSLTALP